MRSGMTTAERLRVRLAARERQGLGRTARGHDPQHLSFATNDYLGLARDPSWRARVAANFAKYPPSSSASRLAGGQSQLKDEVEAEMAAFFGHERCILFPSGWQANQAIVSALVERGQPVFVDKEAHASVMTSLLAGKGEVRGFAHMDMRHLARRLGQHERRAAEDAAAGAAPDASFGALSGQPIVFVESLYGMGGEVLEPNLMGDIRARHNPFLVVDEAHAMGVLGDKGRGVWHGAGADVVLGTLGKAFGLFGAFVLASSLVAKALENFAAPLVYSTALPDAHAACCRDLVRLLPLLEDRRASLRILARTLCEELRGAGIVHRGDAHVILLPMGSVAMALEARDRLGSLGLDLFCARYPTTPPDRPALRISLSAAHTREQVLELVRALARVLAGSGGTNVLGDCQKTLPVVGKADSPEAPGSRRKDSATSSTTGFEA